MWPLWVTGSHELRCLLSLNNLIVVNWTTRLVRMLLSFNCQPTACSQSLEWIHRRPNVLTLCTHENNFTYTIEIHRWWLPILAKSFTPYVPWWTQPFQSDNCNVPCWQKNKIELFLHFILFYFLFCFLTLILTVLCKYVYQCALW